MLRAVCGAGTRARERAHHPPQFYFYWFTNSLQSSLSEALLFIQFHFIKFDNWHYKAEETLSFVAGRMKTSGHVATSSSDVALPWGDGSTESNRKEHTMTLSARCVWGMARGTDPRSQRMPVIVIFAGISLLHPIYFFSSAHCHLTSAPAASECLLHMNTALPFGETLDPHLTSDGASSVYLKNEYPSQSSLVLV